MKNIEIKVQQCNMFLKKRMLAIEKALLNYYPNHMIITCHDKYLSTCNLQEIIPYEEFLVNTPVNLINISTPDPNNKSQFKYLLEKTFKRSPLYYMLLFRDIKGYTSLNIHTQDMVTSIRIRYATIPLIVLQEHHDSNN